MPERTRYDFKGRIRRSGIEYYVWSTRHGGTYFSWFIAVDRFWRKPE